VGLGLGKGERVCIFLPNCIEFLVGYWAVIKAGGVVVPTSVLRTDEGLLHEVGISGSRMVICDDSIVRGTQLKNYTIKKLMDNGAREIHIRPACPPLMFPCVFASSTRSKSELACRRAIRAIEGADIDDVSEYLNHRSEKYRNMVAWIRRDLNVTSLKYLNIEDMIEAIGLPESQLCLYCWQGQ